MIRARRTLTTAVAIAAVAAVPLAGCSSSADEEAAPSAEASQSPSTSDEGGEGIGESGDGGAAGDSLEGKVGQDVSFMGEIAEMIEPNAITVGGDEVGENPILVVGTDLPTGIEVGDTVQVRGSVEEFDLVGFEDDLDLDLVDDEFADFDGGLAIKATTAEDVTTM